MAISNSDGSIILQTKVDQSGINKGLFGIKSAVSKIGAAVGVAFSVTALVRFGKAAISLASDLQEVQNVVDVAFGSMKQSMEDFADTAIETYGISKLTAKQTGSSYMAMAKGMQIADEAAAEMALTLTGLSADMASFYNISQGEARTALSAVFTGETETLKRYGILITEVNLQEFARQQGITKSINKMTQQEKVMLRYQYILQSTQLAQGDFVRTQDSWANQTRVLQERWKEMQTTFGDAFIVLGQLVLPVVNAVVKGLTSIANITKVAFTNLAAIFGKEVSTAEQKTNQTAQNIEQQTENQEELNKAVKKGLAGFDEINQLAEETASSQEEGANPNKDIVVGGGGGDISSTVGDINSTLALIMGIVGDAMIAIGLLLLFTGNIAWGIGFIIFGGITMSVTIGAVSGTNIDTETSKKIESITKIIGGSMVAIGLLLLFLGQIPWGLGFIAAGAGLVSVSEIFPTTTSEDVKSNCDAILSFLAGLTAYLVAQALLKNWATFVALWKDFRALMQLIHTEGFFRTITGLFGSSLSTMQLWAIAIGVVVGSIAYLALNWDKLSPAQRVITILSALAAAATAAAVAIALFHTSWSVGIAAAAIAGGVALLAGTYLFKNANAKKSLSSGGSAPSDISQYAYLAEGGTYNLPHLAQGTVVPPNKEFMAVLGDNTREHEIVSPVSTIKQAVAEVLVQSNIGGSGFNGRIEVPVIINGREIARAVRDAEEDLGTQTVFGGFAHAY